MIHKFPLTELPKISTPFSSTKQGLTPGNGNVACAGLCGVTPAKLEIIIPPVSVCHQVSTIGHFSFPIFLKYHCHASSLIGSPTVPNTFNELKSLLFTKSKP